MMSSPMISSVHPSNKIQGMWSHHQETDSDKCLVRDCCDFADDDVTFSSRTSSTASTVSDLDYDANECGSSADDGFDSDSNDSFCSQFEVFDRTVVEDAPECKHTLESLSLDLPRPSRLATVFEISDEGVDVVAPSDSSCAFYLPMQVIASEAVSRGRKGKSRTRMTTVDEPIKKRPLFPHQLPSPTDEFEPMRLKVRPGLQEDFFGDFLRSLIQN